MNHCEWCGRELNGWYLKYRGKFFCRIKDDGCLKNYLYEQADEEIELEKYQKSDYRMDMVTWMEDRGLD